MSCRLLLSFIFIGFFSSLTHAQEYKFIYYLDSNLNSVNKAAATYIGKGYHDKDQFALDCFDAVNNKLLTSSHFTDSSLTILDGLYRVFYADGKPASEGYFKNNEREGAWSYWNDLGQQVDSMVYVQGVRTIFASYGYYDKHTSRRVSYSLTDSLANTFMKLQYDSNGVMYQEARFLGNRGVLTRYIDEKVVVDSVFTREEKEASFPGPDGAWTRYVMSKVSGFNPGQAGAPYGKYRVMVKFIIDTTGTIVDVTPETNFGYKMEETVVKVIQKAPKWNPAMQYGRKLKAYRRQPMTFLVSGD